jgi:hypothetical protein
MMRVMISTLCQQGQVYSQFMLSVLECYQKSIEHKNQVAKEIIAQIPGFSAENPEHKRAFDMNMAHHTIDIGLYTQGGESLLARGRNHAAQVALTQGWDKIFFIDADEGFTWQDFVTIAGSPHPVSAGLVPLKTYPKYPLSFETSLNFLPFLEDEKYFDNGLRTLASTIKMAEGRGSAWLKVAYTGTGFLCVDVKVLAKLAETCSEYVYPNPHTGNPETHWSFFDGGPMHGQYYSEDWQFCSKARDAGFDIMVNVNVRATHTGPHQFLAG